MRCALDLLGPLILPAGSWRRPKFQPGILPASSRRASDRHDRPARDVRSISHRPVHSQPGEISVGSRSGHDGKQISVRLWSGHDGKLSVNWALEYCVTLNTGKNTSLNACCYDISLPGVLLLQVALLQRKVLSQWMVLHWWLVW